jgi:hypothetical protein
VLPLKNTSAQYNISNASDNRLERLKRIGPSAWSIHALEAGCPNRRQGIFQRSSVFLAPRSQVAFCKKDTVDHADCLFIFPACTRGNLFSTTNHSLNTFYEMVHDALIARCMSIRFSCVPPQLTISMKNHLVPKSIARRKSSNRRGKASKFKPLDVRKLPGGISYSVLTEHFVKPCWGWPPF